MEIELRNLNRTYGNHHVVKGLNLGLEKGEMVALLGPSGCGKTTTLRMVAGFVDVSDGEIHLRGRNVTRLPAHKRDCGLVFQSYALFPHMSVAENVAFGLRRRGVPAAERVARVTKVLSLMQLDGLGERLPAQLSGGQQQRVAVARALVINPAILLLDEPFSNLDAKLRASTGHELRHIQKSLGLTSIFVTHDQDEAMGIADRIAVMNNGIIEQLGSAQDIYARPATRFIASFIGKANFLPARVISQRDAVVELQMGPRLQLAAQQLPDDGRAVDVMIRPEHIALCPPGTGDLDARVGNVTFQGSVTVHQLVVGENQPLQVETHGPHALASAGAAVGLRIDPMAVRAFAAA